MSNGSLIRGLGWTLLGALGACGGGGGGAATVVAESGTNDSAASANPISVGRPASGSLDSTGDVDFWSVPLGAGQVVELELFATRLDQARWDTVVNAPRLTLYDTDGATKLLEHDLGGFTSAGWGWGMHDLDIPLFRAPAAGTYFVGLRQADVTRQGGDYVFVLRPRTAGGFQSEGELPGTSGANDTTATAETFTPGLLYGFHADGELDVFAFAVSAPSLVRFEVTAYRSGVCQGDDAYSDLGLRLLDVDGSTELAANDEAFFSDPALHFRLDTPGTYFVALEESGGTGDGHYFLGFERESLAGLALESEDNDTTGTAQVLAYGARIQGTLDAADPDVFVFQGTAGDLVRAQTFDQDNYQGVVGEVALQVLRSDGLTLVPSAPDRALHFHSFLLQQSGAHFLVLSTAADTPGYMLRLERFRSSAFESENNDSIANADALDASGRASGVIAVNDDQDFFGFPASAGVPVTLQVYAKASVHSDGFLELSGHGSQLQPFVRIRNAGGGQLANSHYGRFIGSEGVLSGLPTCAVTFVPSASGTYYVEIESIVNLGSADSHYLVEKR